MTRDRHKGETDSTVSYRWHCPICGKSGLRIYEDDEEDNGIAHFETTLRLHISHTNDADHGPEGSHPDSVTSDTLREFITVGDD